MSTYSAAGGDGSRPLRFLVRFPRDTHAVLELEGDLDAANTDLLASVLDAVLVAGGRTVEIHTTNVDFAACSLIGVIEHHARMFSAAGGTLVLADTSPAVRRLLELAHPAEDTERPATTLT